uniref:Uncharacterized protein n=1 Tax=Marseillevirus LCMAC103 TaxID=2506604 RepID=A0A481YVF2_9VIRU|nr:MAG: hypothetical protein LCMAC103_04230 [Marseillevirus LCMAC103]
MIGENSGTFETCRLFHYDDDSVKFFIERLERFAFSELDELVEYVVSTGAAGAPETDLLKAPVVVNYE